MLPLRNPAHASVEFFASTLWGDLQIQTDSPAVEQAIKRVWTWSNWAAKQTVSARWAAIYGKLFTKVAQSPGRVYFQFPPIETIGDNFEIDDRGYVTWIRIDTPLADNFVNTEVWDMTGYRMWRHQLGGDANVERLATPLEEITLAQMGIDFIPIVYTKFIDVGDRHGVGAFQHALDPIDEANRMATRLHQALFRWNKPMWAVTHEGVDKSGRPLPALNPGTVAFDDDTLVSLPGGGQLQSLVPDVRYDAALAILNSHMDYIRDYYLPELAFYSTKADSNTSGRAIRLSLSAAISKCEEARRNLDAGLKRADEIALTLGVNAGLFGGIGSFEQGAFEHTFLPREVIPVDSYDQAQEAGLWVTAGVPVAVAAHWVGRSEADIAELPRQTMGSNQVAA